VAENYSIYLLGTCVKNRDIENIWQLIARRQNAVSTTAEFSKVIICQSVLALAFVLLIVFQVVKIIRWLAVFSGTTAVMMKIRFISCSTLR